MAITSALVLYAVCWFMTLFVVLPIGLRTQGDVGEIEPGTHAGAPADLSMKRKFLWTTVAGTVIWAIISAIIIWGGISVRDLDWFDRMDPPAAATTG
ncbi:DUF1467 family protein [Palleronia sediminis]|uniref:DUF1467 family protein n=1 Tax=Palleronia sediminis TaxID=2547833 RepID=A0A4R5ZXY2_9RHOB|nr:DUF1467 family protein [Palleronia sediminis]TDL76050.1 DUF1467 family protein [Palleronia sediminis]